MKTQEEKRFARRGRLIVVNGENWRYRVGGGSVVAFSESGKKLTDTCWDVKGIDIYSYERGRGKRTSDGAVYPVEIKNWIEINK